MKKLSVAVVIALCTCATFFCDRDTRRPKKWPRDIEARLSNATEWSRCRAKGPVVDRVVPESVCETAIVEQPKPCWHFENDVDSARWALSFQPHCINSAIAVLEKYAPTDAQATSDLAAALYLRAQRDDEPADLLVALTHADAAVIANPSLPEARFNRALILETLAVPDEAIAAWNEFIAIGDREWREEAIERRNRLKGIVSDRDRWNRARRELPSALRARDATKVKQLIEPFPSPAYRYFEEDLLLLWAQEPTSEHLSQLSLFAQALSERLGDPFAVDTVNAIARAKDSRALQEAHRTYAEARRGGSYGHIEDLFAKADSPFALLVAIRKGQPASEEAEIRKYPYLAGIAHAMRGYLLSRSQFVPSLTTYEKARRAFADSRDEERLAAIHTRLGGVYGGLGDRRNAWRETFYAQHHQHRLTQSNDRTAQYLEIALASRKWGQYALAVRYLDRHIAEIGNNRGDLAIALRHRAQAFLDLGNLDAAARDLDRLIALPESEKVDRETADWLTARRAELLGQKYLKDGAWTAAVHQFNIALQKTPALFTTLRALLLTERAEAQEGAGNVEEALKDHEAAVAILQAEATAQLSQRELDPAEEAWLPYFNRFQDTYRAAIRLRMRRGDSTQAFAFAEQARAAEPLNRVGRSPATIPELRENLPPDTYILEYCVLRDETFVWLIGRETVRTFTVDDGRRDFEQWIARLENLIRDGRLKEFDEVMRIAYGALTADALTLVPRNARLVIVPDGPLHALPFGAFRDPGGQYLVQKHVIEFSGSAALYLHSLDRDSEISWSADPSVLSIGNPAFDPTLPFAYDLPKLEYAESEAHAVRALYNSGTTLIGPVATVPALLAHAPSGNVIHFAAHGVVNAEKPEQSAILLAPSPGHRGALQPQELLRGLKLEQTRLVVLAVCNGIGGTPVGSEGVAPLVRPILAAGAPGVIGSLWVVGDTATTEALMVSFHRQYKTGSDAATALRKAQVAAINDKKPVTAWAGFQMIGHASSPFAPRAPAQGGTSLGIHSSNSLQRSDRLRSQ